MLALKRCLDAEMNRRMIPLGFTWVQARLIFALEAQPGLAQAHLATLLESDPAAISRQVARLEDLNLVVTARDDSDRRVRRVWLTAGGEQTARSLHSVCNEVSARFVERAGPGRTEALITLIHDVLAGLEECPAMQAPAIPS
jgi:DNA-binding MarR family transcriptional regulator